MVNASLRRYQGEDLLSQQYVHGNYIDEVLVVDRNLNADDSAIGPGDQRLFYHQNSLMHVYALTDITGTIIEGYLYDAYGQHKVYQPGANGVVEFGSGDIIVATGPSGVGNPYLFHRTPGRYGNRFVVLSNTLFRYKSRPFY